MSGKSVGQKVGGKGSWRRKVKRVLDDPGAKLWTACVNARCRSCGVIEKCLFLSQGDYGYSFTKPEMLYNIEANAYVIRGTPEKKSLKDILQEFLVPNARLATRDDKVEELGDVSNVNFAEGDKEEVKEESNEEVKEEEPKEEAKVEEPAEEVKEESNE